MIKPWRERLDWTGQRSPSNKDRMDAMQAEIRELRAALAAKLKPIARLERLLESSRLRAEHWRKLAYAIQREATKPVRKIPENCGTGHCSCVQCFKSK